MSTLPMPRVFSTLSPSDLYTQPGLTEIAQMDWLKVRRYLSGSYPKPLPTIHEWTADATGALQGELGFCPFLVIDTEYNPETGRMFTLGIGGPGSSVWQWWPQRPNAAPRALVRETLRALCGSRPVWFQNCMADLAILKGNLNLGWSDFLAVQDTMFLHSLLWTELPHDLEFLASVYGVCEKLKHLPLSDPRYNAGDIVETAAVAVALQAEGARDPQTMWVFQNCMMPLVPIILEAQAKGIRIDRSAVKAVQLQYEANKEAAKQIAWSYAGYPINIGSPSQLVAFLNYDLQAWGVKPPKKGQPIVSSADEDSIAKLREIISPFDPSDEVTIEHVQKRIAAGAHPLLEARVLYARAVQWLSHYIDPFLASSDGRIYPKFHPWTQNTGRWSTVDPPVAQLPHALRDALLPDAGWLWFEFDFSAIELRLIAALSGDPIMLEAFAKDWDLHTVHMCDAFGWPASKGWTKKEIKADLEWQAKLPANREEFRTFIKQMVFRLCYGGVPEGAPSIPGAKSLGLDDKVLIAASKRWIAKHPWVKRFWSQLTQQSLKQRQARTFLGRRWNFLGHDMKRIQRQLYDFPMQGGVADIKNLVLIQIKAALGDRVRLSYEMHDSLKLQIKITEHLEADKETIIKIAEQPWKIGGREIGFPVEWSERAAV